jgi:glucose/arabinose dehydrogenase
MLRGRAVAFLAVLWLASGCDSSGAPPPGPDPAGLQAHDLVTGLDTPWDLAWGPDGMLWVSERGGRISRVDPRSGARTTVGQLAVAESGESGLLGIALHPDFATEPYLYAMHSFEAGGIRNRLVRARYENGALGPPRVLLDSIPGASVHDGSRLVVGPDRFLYVSTGDAAQPALAQDRGALAGKILRLTLDGAPASGNPFGTAVYTYGHRNPQGLVFAPGGALYSTEHGPGDNDEVNRIEPGRNYGWPTVHGFCDDDISGGEVSFCQANGVAEPLAAWTPTIAPCGADFYAASLIPGWAGSLLFTTLKDATLYRLALAPDGRTVTATERLYARRFGRLRDVLVGPRGEVYVATSNRDGRGSPGPDDDRIIRIEP